jgi:hypothetical protein
VTGLTPLEERCVKPFYLHLMGLNALRDPVPYDELRDVTALLTDEEVVTLLQGPWRQRVMGAWFSLGRTDRIGEELLASLATSTDSLARPPLVAVAVHGLGAAAAPELRTGLEAELAGGREWAGFVAAALELVERRTYDVDVTDQNRSDLADMVGVALLLG